MHIHAAMSCLLAVISTLLVCCAEGSDPVSLDEVKAETRGRHPNISHVSPDEVARWIKDESAHGQPLLFDVREAEEFNVSHLEGAVRIQPGANAGDLIDGELKGVGRDRRIVLYCSVGVRSAAATQRLKNAGFTNVHNMNGSIFQWANEGRPIYCGSEKASKVHPYDKHWGRYLKPELRAER